MRGQGAGHSALMSAVWRGWSAVYSSPALYRTASWLASRLRWLTPRRQAGWTSVRTPLQPAPKRLRDLIKERN
jgi:L-lactate dehydrogenase complex protein LldF